MLNLTGIECPHSIKTLLYKNIDPLNEIHWLYLKKTYILTYHLKLNSVPGPKFKKTEPTEAMKQPPLINLSGNKKRDKDETFKRQTEWGSQLNGLYPGHDIRNFQNVIFYFSL